MEQHLDALSKAEESLLSILDISSNILGTLGTATTSIEFDQKNTLIIQKVNEVHEIVGDAILAVAKEKMSRNIDTIKGDDKKEKVKEKK